MSFLTSDNHNISVVIPVYNAALYLPEAIDSVLTQSLRPKEIIIINDGSIDNTKKVLDKYNNYVIYKSIPHQGAAFARNTGVKLCSGKYVAFLDADDVWKKEKLEKQQEALLAEKLDFVFTNLQQFSTSSSRKIREDKLILKGICASTLFTRLQYFKQTGGFCASYTLGEFMHWFLRTLKRGASYKVLSDIHALRRIHDANTSALNIKDRSDYLRLFREIRMKSNE